MPITYDRSGVPQYAGDPEDWKEYRERVLDYFYGCRYDDQKNAAIRLRGGLSGRAFESVRTLKHETLFCKGDDETKTIIDSAPLNNFLAAMEKGVLPERPIRAAELYDRAVYGHNVRRQPTETMADYCVRRATDWEELSKVSADTGVSSDLQGYMLLRFSGLSRVEQTQALSSAGNSYDLKGIEAALRLQHPYAHKYSRERRAPSAYAVDADLEHVDENYDGYGDEFGFDEDDEHQDDVYAIDVQDDLYDDELGDDIPDADQVNDYDLEVYATMAQARHGKSGGKHGGRSKGKGKGRGSSSGSMAPPTSQSMLPPDVGSKDDDRATRISQLKAKTQCLDCGRFGHWRGDPECSQTKDSSRSGKGGYSSRPPPKGGKFGGKAGRGGKFGGKHAGRRPVYAVFRDDDDQHEKTIFVVEKVEKEKKPRAARSDEDVECRHCDVGHVSDTRRGANQTHRWMVCQPCNRRMVTQRRRDGVQAWAWLAIGALYTQFGSRMRQLLIHRTSVQDRAPQARRPWSRGPTSIPRRRRERPDKFDEEVDDEYMPDEGAVAPPSRVPRQLRPETLVGSGLYAAWRHDEMFASKDQTVVRACQVIIDDKSTRDEGNPFHSLAAYLRHHEWCADWEPDVLMAIRGGSRYDVAAGTAVWDTACGLTVHSPSWRERFVAELAKHGLAAHRRDLQEHERVRGIGGQMKLSSCWVFPFGLYGVNGQITSYELDQSIDEKEIPMLISNTVQRKLLISISLGDDASPDRVCFRAWGNDVYDLDRAPNGNPASSLLNFAAEGHPGVSELSDCYAVVLEPSFDTWDGGDGIAGDEEKSKFQVDIEDDEKKADDEDFEKKLQGLEDFAMTEDWPSYEDYEFLAERRVDGAKRFPTLPRRSRNLWHLVDRRVVKDLSGNVLLDEVDVQKLTNERLYREIADGPRDVIATFYHKVRGGEEELDIGFEDDSLADLAPDGGESDTADVDMCDAPFDVYEDNVRKTTGHGQRMIARNAQALMIEDALRDKVLKSTRPRYLLPGCDTLVKQLFAGVMGLSLIACNAGYPVGRPLDLETNGWDANSKAGARWLRSEIATEDPVLITTSFPCSPWGGPSNINVFLGGSARETVLQQREEAKKHLALTAKICATHVRRGRHILIEQPRGSLAMKQPEMQPIIDLKESGHVFLVRCPGCQLGYYDPESDLPFAKPMEFWTTLASFRDKAEKLECRCSTHAPLLGTGKTRGTAEWPEKLDRLIYDSVLEQIERDTMPDIQAVGLRTAKQRRTELVPDQLGGSASAVTSASAAAADADVREEGEAQDAAPPTPLDPNLPSEERDRRTKWRDAPEVLKQELLKVHRAFNHPPNVTLARLIARAGGTSEAVKYALVLPCDACDANQKKHKHPRVTTIPGKFRFNAVVFLDSIFVHDMAGAVHTCLSIVDNGSCFQVVVYLRPGYGTPPASSIKEAFTNAWSAWAGLPQGVMMDRGKEFSGPVLDYFSQHGVQTDFAALESPWHIGRGERHGSIFKDALHKVVYDQHVVGEASLRDAIPIVVQSKNEMLRHAGYSPNMWVLGSAGPRLPGSLLDADEAARIEVQQAADDPESEMGRTLATREAARLAFVRLDNSSRYRRALLRRSVPQRGPYPLGCYVYFRRSNIRKGETAAPGMRWFGPARVIGHEGASADTMGTNVSDAHAKAGVSHGIWLRYQNTSILASPEQLRFASDDELLAFNIMHGDDPPTRAGPKSHLDVRRDVSLAPARPIPSLPVSAPPPPLEEGPHQQPLIVEAAPAVAPPELDDLYGPATPRATETRQPDPRSHSAERSVRPRLGDNTMEVEAPPWIDRDLEADRTRMKAPAVEADLKQRGRSRSRLRRSDESVFLVSDPGTCSLVADALRLRGVDDVPSVFLTGRAQMREFKYRSMNTPTREAFNKAMRDEWQNFLNFDAIRPLTLEETSYIKENDTVPVKMRWILTDKNDRLRSSKPSLPLKAKARLVVRGDLEDPTGIRSDAPTASLLSFQVLCSTAASRRWKLTSADAASAYLQSGNIDRFLVLSAPDPPPPGTTPGALYRALGAIYGTRDAGRSFWEHLVKETTVNGKWVQSKLDRCLYRLYGDDGQLIGLCTSHVDDLLLCGDGSDVWVREVERLREALHLTVSTNKFRYCGKNVEQHDDYSVSIDQVESIDSLETIDLPKDKRKNTETLLDAAEISELRSGNGALGWIARQSRPDVAFHTSKIAQSMGMPRVRDVLLYNKAVHMLKESRDHKFDFAAGLDYDTAEIVAFSDASFANIDDEKLGQDVRSQCGVCALLVSPNIASGPVVAHILLWESSSSKRVVRSTLAAEAYAASEAAEALAWLRALYKEIDTGHFESHEGARPSHLLTDARSLVDAVSSDVGRTRDRRLRIVLAALREAMDIEQINLSWVDTLVQLADVLTKDGVEREQMHVAMRGSVDISSPDEALARKEAARASRAARADIRREARNAARVRASVEIFHVRKRTRMQTSFPCLPADESHRSEFGRVRFSQQFK